MFGHFYSHLSWCGDFLDYGIATKEVNIDVSSKIQFISLFFFSTESYDLACHPNSLPVWQAKCTIIRETKVYKAKTMV